MGAHVYMLRCAEGSFYVGSATGEDLTLRIAQHQAGTLEGYTSLRRPIELVWSEYFYRITDAIATERKIKGWSRAKKEALIKGDWNEVQQLAKRRGGKPNPRPQARSIPVILRREPHLRASLEGWSATVGPSPFEAHLRKSFGGHLRVTEIERRVAQLRDFLPPQPL